MTDWLRIYRNTDDDTLAALGSSGLVRRAIKDVEAGKVAWASPPHLLRADGQLVRIDAGGPARASCDCPAPGVCKHILAATIWLRQAAPQPGAASCAHAPNATNATNATISAPPAGQAVAATLADTVAAAAPETADAGGGASTALSSLLAEALARYLAQPGTAHGIALLYLCLTCAEL